MFLICWWNDNFWFIMSKISTSLLLLSFFVGSKFAKFCFHQHRYSYSLNGIFLYLKSHSSHKTNQLLSDSLLVWVLLYVFSFYHKQCGSGKKHFTFVKCTSQMFRRADESLNDEMHLLLLDASLVTLPTWGSSIQHLRSGKFTVYSQEQSF